MQQKEHWDSVYSTKPINSVSWFQEHAETSLRLIREINYPFSASIIDIGGGASTLVDDLIQYGYTNLTVLDISPAALNAAKKRLDTRSINVHWIEADITKVSLPTSAYDIWHDRAVFHFLTSAQDRQTYVETVIRTIKPGGHVIVGTFADDGPTQCSGLPVMRYSVKELHAEFGLSFTLLQHENEEHHTPSGTVQKFVYCKFRIT